MNSDKRNKRANAEPSGGGGGGWAETNKKMAERRAELQGGEGPTSGTSIFDPVLAELAYRWFSPPDGIVLDPFAGGSVRGVVASHLGRRYVGVDLRPEQVQANNDQIPICKHPVPDWRVGDAVNVATLCSDIEADFVFSCPPYGDLEVYSEDPADLSVMEFADFLAAYRTIIDGACSLLKADRFACFVVGDFRDRQGFYRNFPGLTVAAFEAAGLKLYNEAILVTAVGSLPVRARKQFTSSRKLGKTHQNFLVFCKGDPAKAAKAIGDVEFGTTSEPTAALNGDDPASRFGVLL